VARRTLEASVRIEGELAPYEAITVFARVNGYVASVPVDRGSRLKKGDVLATIAAPELAAQRAEADAKTAAARSTFEHLRAASKTEGAVAGHDVELAEAAFHAEAARAASLRDLERYLRITAPFDGVVTERDVHPGALVGPQAGTTTPMFRFEQVGALRLTIPVPEQLASVVSEGTTATFSVRAWPGVKFTGTTRRISHAVETRTRAMMVELDVDNEDGRLAPGMFAEVDWPVKRAEPTLFVPASAVVQATDKTFVARVKDGVVEAVPVERGASMGADLEVFGALREGDEVARRGSEELQTGVHVAVRGAKR
ncbi:MAG TPA: efflux RND transporter periplasmic adaptor subunit, partial [Minicystis sp.]|nr:efflux RND transporter periplasmic adaptor subunit [Minicystis sp.]